MTIKLPKNIKDQFDFMKNSNINGVRPQQITPRNLLNFIESNNNVLGFKNLYKYLFDSKGCQHNQLKFLNAFYGQEYKFEDERFNYFTRDGFKIMYIPTSNQFILNPLPKGIYLKPREDAVDNFTRDKILDSPLDINKLKEVPLNETNSNDSND